MRFNGIFRCVGLGLAGLALCAASSRAGDTAYVNMETIFEGYYKTMRANAAFEQKKKDFEERLSILRDELKGMVGEARRLEGDVGNELLSEESREESRRKLKLRVERLRAKEEEFGQFRQEGMRELNRNRVAAEKELIEDITEFVRTYCKNAGYRLVYDINGRSLNRVPVLLVYPEEEEITDEVLIAINKGHEEELAKAKAELDDLRGDEGEETDAEGEQEDAIE